MTARYVPEIVNAAQGATLKAEKVFKDNFGFELSQMQQSSLQIAIYHIFEAAIDYKKAEPFGEGVPK